MSDAAWLWHAARPVRGAAPVTPPTPAIADLARRHGVVVPLREALRDAGLADPALDALAADVQRKNLARLGELVRLVDAFDRAGVDAWPIKGPVWSVLAWGRADLRQSSDLDVLARGDQFAAAAKVLLAEGWSDPGLAHLWRANPRRWPQEVPFSHEARGHVDLHHALLPHHAAIGLDDRPRSGVRVAVAGRDVTTLDPVDALIFTCAHAAGHGFARVSWVGDVAGLVARGRLDAGDVRSRAAEVGALRITRVGLILARRLLDVGLEVGEDPVAEAPADEIAPRILDQGLNTGGLDRAIRLLRARDGWVDRARYLARWPGDLSWEDFAAAALPARAFGWYPVVRWWRLARRG